MNIGDKVKLNPGYNKHHGLIKHVIEREGIEPDKVYTVGGFYKNHNFWLVEQSQRMGYDDDGMFLLVNEPDYLSITRSLA